MLLVTIDAAWDNPSSEFDLDVSDVLYEIHFVDVDYVNLRDSGLADRDPARYNIEMEKILRRRNKIDGMRESVEATWGPVMWDDRPAKPSTPAPRPRPTAEEVAELDRLYKVAADAMPDEDPFDALFLPEAERADYDAQMEAAAPLCEQAEAYRRSLEATYSSGPGDDIFTR